MNKQEQTYMYADRPSYVDSPTIFDTYGPDLKGVQDRQMYPPFRKLYEDALAEFCARLAYCLDNEDKKLFVPKHAKNEGTSEMGLVSECISFAVKRIKPPENNMGKYIRADPTLAHPTEWTASHQEVNYMNPSEIASTQLITWVRASLQKFWRNRFEGRRVVICNVTVDRIRVDRVIPPEIEKYIYD